MILNLKRLKDIFDTPCISILLPTHRTSPDNQNDPLLLKNLVKEVSARVSQDLDKREAKALIERLEATANGVNHSFNTEGLAIFVNAEISEIVRLPVSVEPKAIFDTTFATKELVRAMHASSRYFVLTLSQRKVRLIEGTNERPLEEVSNDLFPFENETLYSTSSQERSAANTEENLIREFMNRAGKRIDEIQKEENLPVVLMGDARVITFFCEVNKLSPIAGEVHGNFDDSSLPVIIEKAWPQVQQFIEKQNDEAKSMMGKAVSEAKLVTDVREIWRLTNEGRGAWLFVRDGYFQSARLEDGLPILLNGSEAPVMGDLDDISDELVERALAFGGRVSFLPSDAQENLALVIRY
jgi:hypothetical protein